MFRNIDRMKFLVLLVHILFVFTATMGTTGIFVSWMHGQTAFGQIETMTLLALWVIVGITFVFAVTTCCAKKE